MFILSITPGQIAGSVWAQAARTLTSLAGQPATDIWASAARTLTADPMPFTGVTARGTVGASTILDLRPAAGKFRLLMMLGAFQTVYTPALYDGANADNATAGVNDPGLQMLGTSVRGQAYNNQTAGGLTYSYAGWDRG